MAANEDARRRAEELFYQAAELPPEERRAFLDTHCSDAAVREEVELLLAQDVRTEDPAARVVQFLSGADADAIKRGKGTTEYSIGREIGRGGMGVIYEVRDPGLRRTVAMKVMLGPPGGRHGEFKGELALESYRAIARLLKQAEGRPSLEEPEIQPAYDSLVRFLEEAEVTAQLDHPGIVPVHELGLDSEGQVYFTMRLVKGRTLDTVFELARNEKDGWNFPRAVGVMVKVCQAVAFAHAKGVIHRDLKPSNVMVGQFGEVYVMDWGLAKVIGKQDRHDIRIKQEFPGSFTTIRSPRRDAAESSESPESPIITMDGAVVGTPAYMAPEQAMGHADEVDAASDVYSLGAMLYSLLTGQPPYVTPGVHLSPRTILGMVTQFPPKRVHELNPEAPPELAAICEQAMAREKEHRYQSSLNMVEDLQAYLDGRVVRAYRTGAVAELKAWVARNRATASVAAAAAVIVVAGLVSFLFYQDAKNTEITKERDQVLRLSDVKSLENLLAEADGLWPCVPEKIPDMREWREKADELVEHLETHRSTLEELQKSALAYDEAARIRDRESHPQAQDLARLEEKRRQLTAEIEECRVIVGNDKRATFLLAADRTVKTEPDTVYFRKRFDFGPQDAGPRDLRLKLTVQAGAVLYLNGEEVARHNLPDGNLGPRIKASRRVDTIRPEDYQRRAPLFGTNVLAAEVHRADAVLDGLFVRPRGLFFSLEVSAGGKVLVSERARWRYEATGDSPGVDWTAVDFPDSSWSEGPAPLGYRFRDGPGKLVELESSLKDLEREITALEKEVSKPRTWTFASQEEQWQHDTIQDLVDALERLRDPDPAKGFASVETRLDFARTVEERTIEDHRQPWDEAIAAIADESRSPWYHGLRISPQLGLVPLGPDPDSGLQEFAHLQTGAIPERKNGRITPTEEMGLVFVLIPPGRFHMGEVGLGLQFPESGELRVEATLENQLGRQLGIEPGDQILKVNGQDVGSRAELEDSLRPLVDADTVRIEVVRDGEPKVLNDQIGVHFDVDAWPLFSAPVHEVPLDAFFLSKYEMTQAQWFRFTSENPSMPLFRFGDKQHSLLHPVERVSWSMCHKVLSQLGLVLPTEAQWEYAARAGTDTAWWTGESNETLMGAANVSDQFCRRHYSGGRSWAVESWDDGYAFSSPVGHYSANPFGLHDVHGNVLEWCRDLFGFYDLEVRPGDGERRVLKPSASKEKEQAVRGGAWNWTASFARSAARFVYGADHQGVEFGVRPARRVDLNPQAARKK